MEQGKPDVLTQAGREAIDGHLSDRFINLDPAGYLLIKLDQEAGLLIAEHYRNTINAQGLATDPDTGDVLSCRGGDPRLPARVYRGRTAKELGIELTERADDPPISRLDHALYLGRELQRAEACLQQGMPYIQD